MSCEKEHYESPEMDPNLPDSYPYQQGQGFQQPLHTWLQGPHKSQTLK